MGVIIAFANQKGGVSKTTSTLNIAAALASAGKKVAAVDMAIVTATSREYILLEILSMIKNNYDYILIDCLPSLGPLAINAFTAADYIIVPVKAQYLDLNGFSLLKNSLDTVRQKTNKKLKILGIFMTMYDERLLEAKETLSDAVRICGENNIHLFSTKISGSTDAPSASRKGLTIFGYKENCKLAKEYRQLVSEILEKEVMTAYKEDVKISSEPMSFPYMFTDPLTGYKKQINKPTVIVTIDAGTFDYRFFGANFFGNS